MPPRVAALLATALSISTITLAAGSAYEIGSPSGHLSPEASTLLATLLGAIVGILGGQRGG